ncbi:MAG: sugar ABC transporter ATP-binding protein [Devosia sp.]
MSETAAPLLELHHISKHFGGTTALDDVSWEVAEGEVHCLIGENGCGKSTLIKIVSGVYDPEPGGSIAFSGNAHSALSPHSAKALGIEVIFQDLSLFPNLSVAENIAAGYASGFAFAPVDRKAMRQRALAAMERAGAQLPLDAPVGTLSISQRQLVAICRGLASSARLLFMDEPTASLTRHEVETLFASVRRLKTQGVSIVFVSHRLEEILEIADRVTVIRDGRKVATLPAREADTDRLSELMTGEAITDELLPPPPASEGPPVIEISGLGRPGEFENVSFAVRKGEVLGITGLLGAGRTELALTLFGMRRPRTGSIRIAGEAVTLRSNADALMHGIAYVSEDRLALGLNLTQSIADNVAITMLSRLRNAWGQVPARARQSLAEIWVERLGVKTQSVRNPVLTLSGGNQQRVSIAKWLATSPRLLILDSPTVGVDVRNKKAIYSIIRALSAEGVAVILISDEVPEVYLNAHRVLHMRGGRVAGEYVPATSSRHAIAEAVYA